MLRNTKSFWLIAGAILTAGCAKQDYPMMGPGMMGPGRPTQNPKHDPAYLNAEEEKMPKILPDTHYAAGMLFEQQGQLDKAILQYRKAVAVNHNFASAYHRLGLTLSAVGQHELAIDALVRAVELRPQNPALRNNLGFEYILTQRWDDAEFQLEQAVELQPDFGRAHVNLGLVRARTGRFDEALVSFKNVMAEPDAYYNLGLTQRGQQKYHEAVQSFRRVLEINPAFSAAQIQLDELTDKISAATPPTTPVEMPTPMPTEVTETVAVISEPIDEPTVETEPCEPTPSATDVLAVLAELMDQPTPIEPTPSPATQEAIAEMPATVELVEPMADADVVIAEAAIEPTEQPEVVRTIVDQEPIEESYRLDIEFIEEIEPTAVAMDWMDDAAIEPSTTNMTEPVATIEDEIDPALAMAATDDDCQDVVTPSQWIPVEPLTQPVAFRESWEMMNELEWKIADLRRQLTEPPTYAVLAAPTDEFKESVEFIELAPVVEVSGTLTWIEPSSDDEIFEDESIEDEMMDEDEIDEEYVEGADEDEADDPTAEAAPTTDEAPVKRESQYDAIPGDQSSMWSRDFDDLSQLLARVIEETRCLDQMASDFAQLHVAPLDDGVDWMNVVPMDDTQPGFEDDEEILLALPTPGVGRPSADGDGDQATP